MTGSGCWGLDLRGAIALVQRGVGVGEPVDTSTACSFSLKIWNAEKVKQKSTKKTALSLIASASHISTPIPGCFSRPDALTRRRGRRG